jgi:tRNA wybutosine-synthesizing protein 4
VPLLSIKDYPDLESQRQRFLSAGWERVEAKDMNQIYTDFLDLQENKRFDVIIIIIIIIIISTSFEMFIFLTLHYRIEKLEIFDELEEWHLIQSHYCLVAAFIDRKKSGLFDTITLTQYTPQQSHTLLSMQQHTSQNMNTSSSKTENSTTLQTPSHN